MYQKYRPPQEILHQNCEYSVVAPFVTRMPQPLIMCISDPEHKPSTVFDLFYAWKVLSDEHPAPNKEILMMSARI